MLYFNDMSELLYYFWVRFYEKKIIIKSVYVFMVNI